MERFVSIPEALRSSSKDVQQNFHHYQQELSEKFQEFREKRLSRKALRLYLATLAIVLGSLSPQPVSSERTDDGYLTKSGSEQSLLFQCNFSDIAPLPADPETMARYNALLNKDGPLAHYMDEVSYGNIEFSGEVDGSFKIGKSSNYINPDSSINYPKIASDCTTKSKIDDKELEQYETLIFAYNGKDFVAQGGMWCKDMGPCWRVVYLPEIMTRESMMLKVLPHELLHGYGLDHIRSANGDEYGSSHDSMSNFTHCGIETEQGCLPVNTHAYQKDLVGWLPDENVTRIMDTTKDIPLEVSTRTPENGTSLILLYSQNPQHFPYYYAIENRAKEGIDSLLKEDGIRIVQVPYGGGNAQEVRATNGKIMLDPGDQFIDENANISVCVQQKNSNGTYLLDIAVGTDRCTVKMTPPKPEEPTPTPEAPKQQYFIYIPQVANP